MRDFERTPEPSGELSPRGADDRSFVVQKHAASHLHYDFRLELDGVLLSWSVPKGPSLSAGERRLAVRTEDHPLAYADFEGVIPKHEYGGGTVLVWDRGTWCPEGDPQRALAKGRLTFSLRGTKLAGRFHLARMKDERSKRENWLLFKGNDASARDGISIVDERPESALTGRTLEEVAASPDRVWHSNRAPAPTVAAPRAPGATKAKPAATKAKPAATKAKPAATKAKSAAARSVAATTAPQSAAKAESRAPLLRAEAGAGRSDVVSLVKRLPLSFALSNLDKVLFPEVNLRKAELIAYFAAVARYALPHLAGRPLTLVRCPNGRGHKCFFQKHVSAGLPAVVERVPIQEAGKRQDYMAVRDLEGLVALAQLGVLELHTWVCHVERLEQPDQLIFDLDPDEGLSWAQVVEAALTTRARLTDLGLESFVKTTGGKGLHVVAPVSPQLGWDEHKALAKAVADSIAREAPDRYLTNMRKSLRKGKLFLDHFRNGRGATAIAPYSTRAREGATVATPLSWEELERGVVPSDFNVYTVSTRLAGGAGDPWGDYAKHKQRVRPAARRLLGLPT